MKTIKFKAIVILFASIILCGACKKEWLDAKPNKALVVPTTVADYQALLDNGFNPPIPMNTNMPSLSMVGDGDYYVTDATYNSLNYPPERGAYLWATTANFYDGQKNLEWIEAYQRILQDNVVLDGISSIKIDGTTQKAYNNVKGTALFFRSYDFYNLSQEYCRVYDASTANTDLGLPLRLSSNINLTVTRSSVQQTYDQMINDLLQAAPLLPTSPLSTIRPSKPAVFALLARVYLSQENYPKALLYADSCLQIQNGLMDFNQLSSNNYSPGIPRFNVETIFYAKLNSYTTFNKSVLIVDPALLQLFASNDLRTSTWFTTYAGNQTFWGTYYGDGSTPFGGIATDEMYLDRAECYARTGNVGLAMNDLNTLLKNRYKTGTFTNLTAANADDALALIVKERRKELCFRNLRWSDLRRLNKDSRFQVTLTRNVNGQSYTLAPNSSRYVLPLDPIETTSGGLQQNPRD